MDAGTWRGIFTLVMFVLFIGVWIWAWSGKRKKDFDEAAQLPLDDGDYIDESPDAGADR
jgi:cytochrome c oxidase cbb3-type subunit 4